MSATPSGVPKSGIVLTLRQGGDGMPGRQAQVLIIGDEPVALLLDSLSWKKKDTLSQ